MTKKKTSPKKGAAKKTATKGAKKGAKKKTAAKGAKKQAQPSRPIPTGPRAGSSASQPRNAGVDQLAFATGGGTAAPEAQVEQARQSAALRRR